MVGGGSTYPKYIIRVSICCTVMATPVLGGQA